MNLTTKMPCLLFIFGANHLSYLNANQTVDNLSLRRFFQYGVDCHWHGHIAHLIAVIDKRNFSFDEVKLMQTMLSSNGVKNFEKSETYFKSLHLFPSRAAKVHPADVVAKA